MNARCALTAGNLVHENIQDHLLALLLLLLLI